MELRIFAEPQEGASYDDLLALARSAEAYGFGGFFCSDHYLRQAPGSGWPGPTDTWITLAGLARETHGIRLGSLMSPATFRHPVPLAISVAQVDAMSGGRIDFGFGAGWFEAEHLAQGIPFPETNERFDRFEEQLEIITGFWSTPEGETFEHAGTYYRLAGSPALPKPCQRPGPPVIIGGNGARRTPRLVARFASEFNHPFRSVESFVQARKRISRACGEVARDPDDLVYSVAQLVCCGADDREVARRAAAIGREPDRLSERGVIGKPAAVVERLAAFAAAGATRAYLQVLDVHDLDHLGLLAADVAAPLRRS